MKFINSITKSTNFRENFKSSLVIFLLSASLISTEIIWTRVFSAEYFYTFAFLVLSLSVLGLGLGSLSARLFPALKNPKHYPLLFIITSVLMIASPILVLKLDIDFTKVFSSGMMILKVLASVLLLSSSFFVGGIILASYFSRSHEKIDILYTSDLIGAGFGVVMSVILMNLFETHNAIFLIVIPVLLSGVLLSKNINKTWCSVLIVVVLCLMPFSKDLLTKQKEERAPVIFEHWDAMAKIKVFDFGKEAWGINIDNAANSPVIAFNGDWDTLKSKNNITTFPVSNLIKQFDSCTFLSLGAGGGGDVLHALNEGATEVHAVEVNSYINEMMTSGFLKDFSGNIYNDTRVTVASEDGRIYVKRFKNKFDIIYSLSSNTFSAFASGSFALAENYLFTTEAFVDYYESLSDKGYLVMEHQFYIPRMTGEVIEALKSLNVDNPEKHIAVYNFPTYRRKVLIVGKQPLQDETLKSAIYPLIPEYHKYIHLLYPCADSLKHNMVNRIVTEGWQSVQNSSPVDLSPCTDNRPFIAQLGLMKNFSFDKLTKVMPWEFMGFPVSKLLIIVILIIVTAVIIPLNILPYFRKGPKIKSKGLLYFFTIGFAFMVVEIVLIQKYTLIIGASSYTLMCILFVLLLASGIGSRFAYRFKNYAPFVFIMAWIVADIFVFPLAVNSIADKSLALRMVYTIMWIFPLGFFMGMPFVKGTKKTGELIDWGFAINGAASVVGSVIVLILAFNYGFNVAMLSGGIAYILAMILLLQKKAWY
jgi:spermidine synthase